MLKIRLPTVFSRTKNKLQALYRSSANYSDDAKKSGEDTGATSESEKDNKQKTDKETTTPKSDQNLDSKKQLLLNLLKNMPLTHSSSPTNKQPNLAKPGGYRKLREKQGLDKQVAKPRPTIRDVAEDLATELGSDSNKIESELRTKMNASKDQKYIESVLNTMKFSNEMQGAEEEVYGYERSYRTRQPQRRHAVQDLRDPTQGKSLFNSEPLGIFTSNGKPLDLNERPDSLKTWNRLEEYETKLSVTRAPANYFEKMIVWTEEGKIWKFPIDNEQGLDDELKTSFVDHIFLEEQIESWCPKKGPIRNFMELVCVGLSKNPYLTVQQKRDHLDWYKNYFEEKKDILQRVTVESESAKLESA